jgi:hypothetical protein
VSFASRRRFVAAIANAFRTAIIAPATVSL